MSFRRLFAIVLPLVAVLVAAAAALPARAEIASELRVRASVCDGGAAPSPDTFCSIHDALDAAAPGDTIVVEQGRYVGPVLLDVRGLTLRGVGRPVIVGGPQAIVVAADDVTVEGFAAHGAAGGAAIHVVAANSSGLPPLRTRILGNTIDAAPSGAGLLLEGSRAEVNGNDVRGGESGIVLDGAQAARITANFIVYSHTGISTHGETNDLEVTGNAVWFAGSDGILIGPGARSVNLSSNTIHSAGANGLHVNGGDLGISDLRVETNIVSEAAAAGVRLVAVRRVPLMRNQVIGNVIERSGGDGLLFDDAASVTAEANTFSRNSCSAIRIGGGSRAITIRSNDFVENGSNSCELPGDAAVAAAIAVDADSEKIELIGNAISGSPVGVFLRTDRDRILVRYNDLWANGTALLHEGSGFVAAECNWWGTRSAPARVLGSANAVVGSVDAVPYSLEALTSGDASDSPCNLGAASSLPIEVGVEWSYFEGTLEPPSDWFAPAFDDSAWSVGASGFGYRAGDTQLSLATQLWDMPGAHLALYLRHDFIVESPAEIVDLVLDVTFDDGFVAYLNGVEVARRNIPTSLTGERPSSTLFAAPAVDGASSRTESIAIDASLLRAGRNTIAVQGHNAALADGDFELTVALFADE